MAEPKRTFSVRRETRRQVVTALTKDEEGVWVVCADPLRTPTGKGGATGFPMLIVTTITDEAETIARRIAEILQEHL